MGCSTASVGFMDRSLRHLCLIFFAGCLGGCTDERSEAESSVATTEAESPLVLGYRAGLASGRADGIELGRIEGARAAKADALKVWAPIGLGFGAALGALVVLFAARGPLRRELQRRQDTRDIRRLLGRGPALDPQIRQRVLGLAERLIALEGTLARDGSLTGADLRTHLAPQLHGMGETILQLASLTQGLRDGQMAAAIKPKTLKMTIQKLEAERARNPETANALSEVIAAERSKLETYEATAAHLRRCELKFDTLAAVLDETQMSIANLAALEHGQLFDASATADRVRSELAALEHALTTAATELASI